MKSQFINYLIACCILVSFNSCKKDADEVDPNIKGNWSTNGAFYGYTLKISPDFKSSFKHYTCTFGWCEYETKAEGKAKIKNNILYIGSSKWKINHYPEKIINSSGNTEWVLGLEGLPTFYK